MLRLAAAALTFTLTASAQDSPAATPEPAAAAAAAATDAAADAAAAATAPPPSCPITGGSYAELNAVGVVLVSQGQIAAGSDCIQRALAQTVGSYRTLSDIAASQGEWSRAVMISRLAMQIDGTAQSNYFHAKRLLQIGDDKGAMEILTRLAPANQEDADFLRVYGINNFRIGNKEEAKKLISRAIELDPENSQLKEDLEAVSA